MKNNINITYLPMRKLKTTTIGVYIHRPLTEAEASKNAVLPYVLRSGCALCGDSEQIYKYLENLYGASLSAGVTNTGDDQTLRFEAQTICDKYAANGEKLTSELLKLVLSVMFEPVTENGAFKKSVTEIEKNNAKDRIQSVMNDKRYYAMRRCAEEMCKGENYAVSPLGTIGGVEEITPQNLYEHYKNIITSSVIDIYICGDADKAELDEIVSQSVSGMQFSDAEIQKTDIHINNGVKNITDRMDVAQGKLSMGFTTDVKPTDDDFFALMVMNSVFGAGAHSKLFNNVREKLSLAYYASSNLVKTKGLMLVNAGIEFKNFNKAYDEILVQLNEIRTGNITAEEFNSSVNAIVNNLESIKDDAAQLHGFLMSERVSQTNRTVDEIKDEIQKVTVDDVIRVSQKIKLDTVYFLTGKEEN